MTTAVQWTIIQSVNHAANQNSMYTRQDTPKPHWGFENLETNNIKIKMELW